MSYLLSLYGPDNHISSILTFSYLEYHMFSIGTLRTRVTHVLTLCSYLFYVSLLMLGVINPLQTNVTRMYQPYAV